MKHHARSLLGLVALLTLGLVAPAAAQVEGIALGDDPRVEADSFRVTQFAGGLNFPMGMEALPDGSILVATSKPTGGSFFQSTGELIRLSDKDGDGVADDAGRVLATDLPGALVALRRAGDLVFVTSAEGGSESITILRRGERWASPLTVTGAIEFYLGGFDHQSYGLAVRPAPRQPDAYELFFNIGASGNDSSGRTARLAGLVEGQVDDASIYRVTVTDLGDAIAASAAEQIASGLRNASALAFDPRTGDLVIGENGIDTPADRIVALSADEIDVIPAAEIGGAVEDFGFPAAYTDYATGETIGAGGIAPAVAFRPIDGSEAEGIASLSPAPAAFPDGLNEGYFAGFHGQYDESSAANEENPLLYADPDSGETFEFVANDSAGVGHLDSLLATEETLFIADLCVDGSLAAATPCGVLYAVQIPLE